MQILEKPSSFAQPYSDRSSTTRGPGGVCSRLLFFLISHLLIPRREVRIVFFPVISFSIQEKNNRKSKTTANSLFVEMMYRAGRKVHQEHGNRVIIVEQSVRKIKEINCNLFKKQYNTLDIEPCFLVQLRFHLILERLLRK